jgi:LPXTG-motif cell wall-anchored protein
MYDKGLTLPATGAAISFWYPLAAAALIALGIALMHMYGGLRAERKGE